MVDGKPVSYSLDSEFSVEEGIRLLQARQDLMTEDLRSNFSKIDRKQILKSTGYSDAQLAAFGLANSVSPNLTSYSILDLKPFVISSIRLTDPYITLGFSKKLQPIIDQVNQESTFPDMVTEIDSENFEIKNKTYAKTPNEFQQQINRLHKTIKNPMTHLHIGIPGHVSDRALVNIVRALETIAILDMALEGTREKLPYYEVSALEKLSSIEAIEGVRSVVLVRRNEWSQPALTHNIEIRQHISIKRGMEQLALAGILAQNHSRLIEIEIPQRYALGSTPVDGNAVILDSVHSNLPGALYYAGKILERQTDRPDIIQASKELIRLSDKMLLNRFEITEESRQQAQALLKRISIRQLLTPNAFLDPIL